MLTDFQLTNMGYYTKMDNGVLRIMWLSDAPINTQRSVLRRVTELLWGSRYFRDGWGGKKPKFILKKDEVVQIPTPEIFVLMLIVLRFRETFNSNNSWREGINTHDGLISDKTGLFNSNINALKQPDAKETEWHNLEYGVKYRSIKETNDKEKFRRNVYKAGLTYLSEIKNFNSFSNSSTTLFLEIAYKTIMSFNNSKSNKPKTRSNDERFKNADKTLKQLQLCDLPLMQRMWEQILFPRVGHSTLNQQLNKLKKQILYEQKNGKYDTYDKFYKFYKKTIDESDVHH